jgi:hypothetical protein
MTKITLTPDILSHKIFKDSFNEKKKSAKYYDYIADKVNFTPLEKKYYEYARAAIGCLAEFAFYGYLIQNNIDFQYNKKIDSRKYSPDIDFILESGVRIDVKSGYYFLKPFNLIKHKIDYVVICRPDLLGKPGVYKKQQYTFVKSYRQLFKRNITVDILGCIPAHDIIQNKVTDYSPFLLPIKNSLYL